MIAGFAAQERTRTVLGIDGSATVDQTWDQIAKIASTADAIGLGRPLRDDEIVLLDEWHAGACGIPDAKTIEAIRLCARLEGVLTDPVYEGKSMAASSISCSPTGSSRARGCCTSTWAGSRRSRVRGCLLKSWRGRPVGSGPTCPQEDGGRPRLHSRA